MPHLSSEPALSLFLKRLLTHSDLNDEECAAVAALPTSQMDVRANHDFVRLGEAVEYACLVERGLVGRSGQTEDGKRQFVSVHVPGEMVDLHSLMVPQADAALNALTHSTVFRVPHSALREVRLLYPAVAGAFWRDCVVQAGIVAQWLVNVGRRDARSRLAHLLCEMALRYARIGGQPANGYELPMTQEQLADALGLTSVHVNRTLMGLRDSDLVAVSRNMVTIHDWAGLALVGEFDPAYLHLENAA